MEKLFGTDGIRGVANKSPITCDIALKVGQAVAFLMRREKHRPRVIIGKDTRLSGYMLESALAAGVCSMGADVILVGPMPTPGIAFIINNMDADCGFVISASHNPFEDNGIKVFAKNGFKLSEEFEKKIEELVSSSKLSDSLAPSPMIGRAFRQEDALGRYIVFLRHTFPNNLSLEGMRIVVDCANGATYRVAPTLLREMRAVVKAINVNPDGKNINKQCGALHPEKLAEIARNFRADIGLAFDGDGDRLIAVDENGGIITGDKILAIVAKRMKEEGRLKNDVVVSTVMSNLGLTLTLDKMGIKNITAPVGDRYVLEEMLRVGANLGGEDSGHIIFLDHHSTGDGIITALQLLSIMLKEGRKLSELAQIMRTYPQILLNIEVKSKPPIAEIEEIKSAIQKAERQLGKDGRILVRYSGTQPLCRIMVEGTEESMIKDLAEMVASAVREKIG